MSKKFEKLTTVENRVDGKTTSTKQYHEESLSIKDKPELMTQILDALDDVLVRGAKTVKFEIEAPTNDSYLVRLVKTKEVR